MAAAGYCLRCKQSFAEPPCGPEHAAEKERLEAQLQKMAQEMGLDKETT